MKNLFWGIRTYSYANNNPLNFTDSKGVMGFGGGGTAGSGRPSLVPVPVCPVPPPPPPPECPPFMSNGGNWGNTGAQTVIWSGAGAIAGAATGPAIGLGAAGGDLVVFLGNLRTLLGARNES